MEVPNWIIRDAIEDNLGPDVQGFVYVVRGGLNYSLTSWSVAAFLDASQADELCEELNEWCREEKVASNGTIVSGAVGSPVIMSGGIASGAVSTLISSGSILSGRVGSGQIGHTTLSSGTIVSGNISLGQWGSGAIGSGFADLGSPPKKLSCPLDSQFEKHWNGYSKVQYEVVTISLRI